MENSDNQDISFVMCTRSVTNKKICLVRIVFAYAYSVVLFCSLGYWLKKKTFFLAIGFAVSTSLLRHKCYYDIEKFKIDLVILASSKTFVDWLIT